MFLCPRQVLIIPEQVAPFMNWTIWFSQQKNREKMANDTLSSSEQSMISISIFLSTHFRFVILILGVSNNSLVMWVMSSKEFRGGSSSLYIRALAASDLIYCLMRGLQAPLLAMVKEDHFSFSAPYSGWFYRACIQLQFTFWYSRQLSRWLLVFMTLDRALVVSMPLRSRGFSTNVTALVAILLANLLACATAVDVFQARHLPSLHYIWICPFGLPEGVFYYIKGADAIITTALLVLASLVIVVFLMRSVRDRSKLGSSDQKPTHQITAMILVVAIMMSLVTFAWFILRSLDTTSAWYKSNEVLMRLLNDLKSAFEQLNYVMNFYVYVLFNLRIRRFFVKKMKKYLRLENKKMEEENTASKTIHSRVTSGAVIKVKGNT